jgi:hypothetical protein
MTCRLSGDQCSETGCVAPPYEAGRCYAHWMLLSAVEKRTAKWELEGSAGPDEWSTEPGGQTISASESTPANLPRCVAYLSTAGDVITLELAGQPEFTQADVRTVVQALQGRYR